MKLYDRVIHRTLAIRGSSGLYLATLRSQLVAVTVVLDDAARPRARHDSGDGRLRDAPVGEFLAKLAALFWTGAENVLDRDLDVGARGASLGSPANLRWLCCLCRRGQGER